MQKVHAGAGKVDARADISLTYLILILLCVVLSEPFSAGAVGA